MKHIKIFTVILVAALALTGCSKNEASNINSNISGSTDTSTNSNLITADSLTAPDVSAPLTSTPPTNEPLKRAEFDSILNVFEEYSYLVCGLAPDVDISGRCCDYFPDCVDKSQYFTEEHPGPRGSSLITYYKVASGDFSTEQGFNKKLDEIFTEKYKAQYLEIAEAHHRFVDGETYVAPMCNLNYDEPKNFHLEISAERTDSDTVIMTLTNQHSNTATVELVKDANDKYRIDKTDSSINNGYDKMFDIPDWFCFDVDLELVYNDITINRPSAWDTTVSSEISKLAELTSFEQCLSMLDGHQYINYELDMHVDNSTSVTEDWADYPFYKVVDGPIADEKLFLQKVSLIYTEKYKEKYLSDPNRKFTFKDGNLYVAKNAPQKLGAHNDDYLMLNSFEKPDDDTVIMNFTAVYTDDEEVRKEEKYAVKFVREGSFCKIDEIDGGVEIALAECLWFYSEIIYEDISISM